MGVSLGFESLVECQKDNKMWIRYKHKFSSGSDRDWSYVEIPDKDELREIGYEPLKNQFPRTWDDVIGEYLSTEMELANQYSYSEHYRGFDYEMIDNPPVEYIMARLNNHKSMIKHHEVEAERFQGMLDDLGHVTKDDFNV